MERGSIAKPRLIESREPIILGATSENIAVPQGKTVVVLYWQPVAGMVGYNLYRSARGVIATNAAPINGDEPIAPVKTCEELKAIVPEGSRAWSMLEAGFAAIATRRTLKVVGNERGLGRLDLGEANKAGKLTAKGVHMFGSAKDLGVVASAPELCSFFEEGLDKEQEMLFEMMANADLQLRLARGLAFIDRAVTAGRSYTYELRGVGRDGSELKWDAKVTIVAGDVRLPDPPSGFVATPGDSRVLTTWNRNPYAFSYLVQRADVSGGPYQALHQEAILYDIVHGLDGQPLAAPKPGFLDYRRWSEEGLPIAHDVAGTAIDGPVNFFTYYYRVASLDILGRPGGWSLDVYARPVDTTPPMSPTDLKVDPCRSPIGLALSWRKVTFDVAGRRELAGLHTYRIYRGETLQELEDPALLAARQVGDCTASPGSLADMTLTWTDVDSVLSPSYGEKDFWYRVRCVDAYGNEGVPSAVVRGRLPDTRAPGYTVMLDSKGFSDHIRVYWEPNNEPDLAGYQVYRSICDCGVPYVPPKHKKKRCDFSFIGEVSLKMAKERFEKEASIYFDDYSLPAGSPLCYAYWIRAFDLSGNLYQPESGCPEHDHEYLCQRLYEESPPPAPILSGLKARNNGVLVEWIASPIQDLKAFHVYRSHKEVDSPVFMGCVFLDGTIDTKPWTGLEPTCEDIPAVLEPDMAKGSFLDATAEPNTTYWYRVSALDWLGNESEGADLSRLPAVSTFTYSTDRPPAPSILPQAASPMAGRGLLVRWNPAYHAELQGFLVFRGNSQSGPYRQVSSLLLENSFEDPSAVHASDYWYRVQAVDQRGKLSEPSSPVRHSY